MATDTIPTNEEIKEELPALQEAFECAHGKDAFMDVYIKQFNERPSMRADNFNRSAHIPLMAYFFSYALGRPDQRYLDAFKLEACKPWAGMKEAHTFDPQQVIKDLHTAVDQYLPEHHAA
jgi:hypothetical protein